MSRAMAEDLPSIYLDNHATTRVDPRVVAAMLPWFDSDYGNAHSLVHLFGERARDAVDLGRASIAACLGTDIDAIVFTGGATEANNLALRGVLEHPRQSRRRVVTLATEHPSVLDPLARLERRGFEVIRLEVRPFTAPDAGAIDLDVLAREVDERTALVSVMGANNEIGTLQPLAEIARIAHEAGALVHCDATQAVGKIPLDMSALGIDLLALSGHKLHGPKGIGVLAVRQGTPRIRLEPLLAGGGHEQGRRSGTLNVPGIVALATAMTLCREEMSVESPRQRALRDRLWRGLSDGIDGLALNGPRLDDAELRLAGNLNVRIPEVDGQTVMMAMPEIAMSSGAACTSNHPEPSHVLRAIGLDDDQVRGSLRFGLSRFTTVDEIDRAIERIVSTVERLRRIAR
ncbi:MAG TPA: cysteine desulfurase family protein [Pirellulaceae bacterium]|nr:cysteine desulfurase family protein [Pirellulaceae bacterium]